MCCQCAANVLRMSHVMSQINAGIGTLLQMQKNQERATGMLN